jgi:hypothetical protein
MYVTIKQCNKILELYIKESIGLLNLINEETDDTKKEEIKNKLILLNTIIESITKYNNTL